MQGADLVFVTCGMGGGTGTGAAPIVAEMARDTGALTVGIVTKPFLFEGRKRMRQAEMGIAEMRKNVDTMIVVPNERLLAVVGKGIPFQDALKKADEVLLHATQGIAGLITSTGIINVDFADVRTIMQNGGAALMGTGIGRGENRAMEAAQQAISSPLLDNVSIAGATGVLINIIGGDDLTLGETTQISEIIHDAAGDDAEIIFGAGNDPAMQGEVRVTVIATGFDRAITGDPGAWAATPRPASCPSPPAPELGRRAGPAAAGARRRGRAPRAPPAAGPPGSRKCRTWKSRPSSGGRWTECAALLALVPLAGHRWPPRPSRSTGSWPWQRLHGRRPDRGHASALAETADTLHRGETISDLFARQQRRPCGDRRPGRGAKLWIPGGSGPGWCSASASDLADSEPSRICFRTDPDSASRSCGERRLGGMPRSSPDRLAPETVRVEGDRQVAVRGAGRPGAGRCARAGERERLAWDLADVYMWQVDFTRDIRPGDRFNVLFERLVSEDGEVRFGRILASDLRVSGKQPPRLPLYDSEGTTGSTTTPRASRCAGPSSGRRCSSAGFRRASRRRATIRSSTRWRAHQGTDYSADPGTPVMAAGDGIVLRAGRAGGYGNLVELRHANGITTRYGHLEPVRPRDTPGARVEPGPGHRLCRARPGSPPAPHLHYEFRVNGVAKDSRRIDPGNGTPVARRRAGGVRTPAGQPLGTALSSPADTGGGTGRAEVGASDPERAGGQQPPARRVFL